MKFAAIIDPQDGNGFIVAIGVGETQDDAVLALTKKAEVGIQFDTYEEAAGTIDVPRLLRIIEGAEDTFVYEYGDV